MKQKSYNYAPQLHITQCTIATTMDIVPPTASETQNAEIAHQRSTQQQNARAKSIIVVDAKAHTLPGHRIDRIEMQKAIDRVTNGNIPSFYLMSARQCLMRVMSLTPTMLPCFTHCK